MQQIDCKRLDSIIDASVNAMDHEAGQYQVVAFHRRSSIFLSYVKRSEEFIYIEHRDLREPKWYTVGAWKCPEEITNSCKLIATLSIESYDMFVYVVTNLETSISSVIFTDLKGKTVLKSDLARTNSPITCIDIDQQRKELLISLRSGRILVYFINMSRNLDSSKQVTNSQV